MTTVGLIGLGAMGSGMAQSLRRAGYGLVSLVLAALAGWGASAAFRLIRL